MLDAKEFPSHWKVVPIADVVFFQEGPGVRKHQYKDVGVKLLNGGNINNGILNLGTTDRHISSDEAEGKYNHFLVDEGDLLIACSGVVVEKFNGKIAYAKAEHLPLCMNTSTMRFKALDAQVLYLDYFRRFLETNFFKKQLQKLITGSAQLNFGPSHIKLMNIPLPPIAEQKRIAAILDKADSVRRKRQQAIDLADDFLRSVFLDMFGDPLVNSKKWQVQNLGELTTKITDGKHGDCEDEVGSGYYFISAKDVNHGRINYENTRQINKKEFDEVHRRTDLQAGDLVMVNTGATIGRVAIVMDDEKTCKSTFQKSVAIIKLKGDLLNSNFLKYIFLLRVKDFASVGSGSAIKNLLLSKMREFPIIVPPMELQRKFDRIVSHIESSSIRDSADSKLNDELFSSLSQKAFAGEL